MPHILDIWCGCTDPVRASKTGSAGECKVLEAPISERTPASVPLVPACDYKPDEDDLIDSKLAWHLTALEPNLISILHLGRVRPGEYTIDGRRVRLYFADKSLYHSGVDELLVHEHGMGTSDTPLQTYLSQVANVAASLQGRTAGASAVSRIPADKRLTFAPAPTASLDPASQRVQEMKVACEQARLREYAAEAYEAALQPHQVAKVQPSENFSVHQANMVCATKPLRAQSHGGLFPPPLRQQKLCYTDAGPARPNTQSSLPFAGVQPTTLTARPRLEATVRTLPVSPPHGTRSISAGPDLSRRASPSRAPPQRPAAPPPVAVLSRPALM